MRESEVKTSFLSKCSNRTTTYKFVQGAILPAVALRFDRRLPDGGCAFVGGSRVRARTDVYHISCLRPVGKVFSQKEQLQTGCETIDSSATKSLMTEYTTTMDSAASVSTRTANPSTEKMSTRRLPPLPPMTQNGRTSRTRRNTAHGLHGISLQNNTQCAPCRWIATWNASGLRGTDPHRRVLWLSAVPQRKASNLSFGARLFIGTASFSESTSVMGHSLSFLLCKNSVLRLRHCGNETLVVSSDQKHTRGCHKGSH